jgi:hypothetical protein
MSSHIFPASKQLADCDFLKTMFNGFIERLDVGGFEDNPVNKAGVFRIIIENLKDSNYHYEAKKLYEFGEITNVWNPLNGRFPKEVEKIKRFAEISFTIANS